ncbi:MAG: DNA-directed RNA polymerase subunit omega [Silvibacterium sp.]
MRSERVFAAMAYVPNRFLLVKLAAKATRKFHRPNTRIEETMNDVLVRFSEVNPIAGAQETGNVRRLRRTEKAKTYSRYARRSQAVA